MLAPDHYFVYSKDRVCNDSSLSMPEPASEGRKECAMHSLKFDAVFELPCCYKSICLLSLSKLYAGALSSIEDYGDPNIQCPACEDTFDFKSALRDQLIHIRDSAELFEATKKAAEEFLDLLNTPIETLRAGFFDYITRKGNIQCPRCLENHQCYGYNGCNNECHACIDCLAGQIDHTLNDNLEQVTDQGLLCCICKTNTIPQSAINYLRGFQATEAIRHSYEVFSARKDPLKRVCPHCSTIVKLPLSPIKVIFCANDLCGRAYCRDCKAEAHSGECQNDSLEQYIQENPGRINRCPGCRQLVEKDEQCNEVTCDHCQYNFCWVCLRDISADEGRHFQRYNCNMGNIPQGVELEQSTAAVEMLSRCQQCRSDDNIRLAICGHTLCEDCLELAIIFFNHLGGEYSNLHLQCLLCQISIPKQMQDLPIVSDEKLQGAHDEAISHSSRLKVKHSNQLEAFFIVVKTPDGYRGIEFYPNGHRPCKPKWWYERVIWWFNGWSW
ncbi:hypothetical protein ACH42_16815 [Endozoicomonas sp. (ex Bugula neritina AB1)]|nr:hypothetical protein ACH42_16815 [Endozoicomonas sp. (ex Bugula neritina AB1)]